MILGSRFLTRLKQTWKGRYVVIFSLFPKFLNKHEAYRVLKMATEKLGEHAVCVLNHHSILPGKEKGEEQHALYYEIS